MGPMSINEAAKQYGVPVSTLHQWVHDELIGILRRPERRGQKMLISGRDVAAVVKHYRLNPGPGRGRRQRLREAVLADST